MATKLLQKKTTNVYNRFAQIQKAQIKLGARMKKSQMELEELIQTLIYRYIKKSKSSEISFEDPKELCNEGLWNKLVFESKPIPEGSKPIYNIKFHFCDEREEYIEGVAIDHMEFAKMMCEIVKNLYNE